MGGNGGKWGGGMGGNGVLWGEVGANNKNCGARVDWFGFPISPHFSSGAFTNAPPPP